MDLNTALFEIHNSPLRHYVYILCEPDGTPFYVGKGIKSRIANHETYAISGKRIKRENELKAEKIRSILASGNQVNYCLDSWHETESAAFAREAALVKAIGRQIFDEGPLLNILPGGEMTDVARKEISDRLKKYFADNPQVVVDLQSKKDEWIKNNPEAYAAYQQRRAEIMRTPRVRNKVSNTLKQTYKDNPELLEQMAERKRKYFVDNPEQVEVARQRAKDLRLADNIIRWIKEKPEEFAAKQAAHSDRVKQWYKDNPERAKAQKEKQAATLRTPEMRAKAAANIKAYAEANPEADKARREKIKERNRLGMTMRQECLALLVQWLVKNGCLSEPYCKSYLTSFAKLKRTGLIPPEFAEAYEACGQAVDAIIRFRERVPALLASLQPVGAVI